MTEKRFTSKDYETNYYTEIYDKDKRLLINEAVDVLNGLHEENKQLKQRITELELLNDGLNYALQNIRKIDVEIDLND